MSKSDELTMAQLIEKVNQCDKAIEQAQSNKNYWLAEINRQVVLANEAINGKQVVLWGWEDEVK